MMNRDESTAVELRTVQSFGMTALFVGYIFFALVVIQVPPVGYGILACVLGLWVSYAVLSTKQSVILPQPSLFLALGITVAVVISSMFWEPGADIKDVAALYMFYVIIPSLYVALHHIGDNINEHVDQAITVAFFGISVAVVLDTVFSGFTVYRSTIFGFNKNAVAFFFEVLYCYLLFESRDKPASWTATVIGVGYATLVLILSKTSIAFGLVFTLGYIFPRLFIPALLMLGVLGGILTFTYDRASLAVLGTAVDRALLWFDAIEKITHSWNRFLFGYGPGNYVSSVNQFALGGKTAIHNYFLQLVHGFGAILLSVILAFFFWIYRRFGILSSGAAAAFWMFNMHSFFDVGWVTGQGFLASLVLGMILARGPRND